ncbi:hypothetical protein BH09PAT4_BH09PAT4_07800 [soil metagenome]
MSEQTPAPPGALAKPGEAVKHGDPYERGLRLVSDHIMPRMADAWLVNDPESFAPDAVRATRVFYSAEDDVTANVTLIAYPESNDTAMVPGSGVVAVADFLKDQHKLEEVAVEGEFFKGKYPPSSDSLDYGDATYFTHDRFAYDGDSYKDPYEDQLANLSLHTLSDGSSRLAAHFGAVGDIQDGAVNPAALDSMTDWLTRSEELKPE